METIYYKVHVEWCKYPFNNEVESKQVRFYRKSKSKGKNKFKLIHGLEIKSETSIEQKESYLIKELNIESVKVKKIN